MEAILFSQTSKFYSKLLEDLLLMDFFLINNSHGVFLSKSRTREKSRTRTKQKRTFINGHIITLIGYISMINDSNYINEGFEYILII